MKKINSILAIGLSACLITCTAFAAAPANMSVDNNTYLISNAYMHDAPTSVPVGPKSFALIPWSEVTTFCHGSSMSGSDSCAFDVYATSDGANPKQIHVATVTFYLSNGEFVNIKQLALQYGLKLAAVAPGKIELDNV